MKKTHLADKLVLSALVLLIVLFFLPLLTGRGGLFVGETALRFYPQQVFLSRYLPRGKIPWGDPHVLAGASPLYSRAFQGAFYPLNWFFLLAGSVNRGGDYFWLVRAPLALHYLLCALFSFAFARRGLRLGGIGSGILALAYTLSPAMASPVASPAMVFIQAWLPLFCLCVIGFFHSGRFGWILAGALLFALASPAGAAPGLFRVVLAVGLFGLGLAVAAGVEKNWRRALRAVAGAGVIIVLGALLAGIYWSGMLEGARASVRGLDAVGDIARPFSPLLPITMLAPDFFGGVTNRHNWGAGYFAPGIRGEGRLLGGVLLLAVVVFGFQLMRSSGRRGSIPEDLRNVWWIFSGMLLLALGMIAGVFSPLLRLLARFLPLLNYFDAGAGNLIQGFALAVLLGISVSLLQNILPDWPRKLMAGYLKIAGILLLIALICPYRVLGRWYFPGFAHLTALNAWGSFFLRPILCLAAALGALALLIRFVRGGLLYRLLAAAVVIEMIFFAYQGFYQSRVFDRSGGGDAAVRHHGPADHPLYRVAALWEPGRGEARGWYRRMSARPDFNNLAWMDGTLSVLGSASPPVDRIFREALLEVAAGFPDELRPDRWGAWFWRNMSVRHLLSPTYMAVDGYRLKDHLPGFYSYEIGNVLPRFYFQDQWVLENVWEKQQVALLEYDLREHGYCSNDTWQSRPLPKLFKWGKAMDVKEWLENFRRLQEDNRVLSMDLTDPNRVKLEVEVKNLSMLVMTDLWHPGWRVVTDTGFRKMLILHRVNYLQRGVWCVPGRYRIVMEFMPPSLPVGLAMTWLGALGLLALSYYTIRQRSSDANPSSGDPPVCED